MIVRELLARIGVQVDERSISRADAAISSLKKGLTALGVGYAAKKAYDFVQNQFEAIASSADELGRLSQKTGIAVEQLQALQFAAHMADVDAGGLQAGLVHLSRAAQEAATVGGAAGAAFYRLGINVKGADGHLKPTNALLGELADKFAAMPDGPEKAALSIELLSRSGAEMIPLLNQGSAGLARMGVEAKRAGVIMGADLVKAGQRLDDATKKLKATLWGLTLSVLGPFVDKMAEGREQFAAWVIAHRKIIATRIHEYIAQIGRALSYVIDLAHRFPAAFAGVALALGAAFAPLTTTIALLSLLADDVLGYFAGRKSVIGLVVDAFKLLGKSIAGIFNAEHPFDALKDEASRFIDWFSNELAVGIAKSIGRNAFDKVFGFMDSITGAPPTSANPGAFANLFSGDAGFGVGALHRGLWALTGGPSPIGGSTTFSPQITVHAPSGDGEGIASSIRKELDSFWDSKMGAATPAGR